MWMLSVYMTFLNSMYGGFALASSLYLIEGIGNGLSTYLFDGQTLGSKVEGFLGGSR
jgi:hypothetical protein